MEANYPLGIFGLVIALIAGFWLLKTGYQGFYFDEFFINLFFQAIVTLGFWPFLSEFFGAEMKTALIIGAVVSFLFVILGRIIFEVFGPHIDFLDP